MQLDSERRTDLIDYEVRYNSAERFLEEYDRNMQHGGIFVPMSDPPPVETLLRLRLSPPYHLKRFHLLGRVVYVNARGAGIQWVDLDRRTKEDLAQVAATCRQANDESIDEALADCLLTEGEDESPSLEGPVGMDSEITLEVEDPEEEGSEGAAGARVSLSAVETAPEIAPETAPETASDASVDEPPVESDSSGLEEDTSELAVPPGEEVMEERLRPRTGRIPSWNGSLELTPVLDLMATLSRKRHSGLLILDAPKGSGRLVFKEGEVVRARLEPALPELRLGDLLVSQKVVSREQVHQALEASFRFKCRLGQALVKTQSVRPERILTALSEQLKRVVTYELELAVGRFEYYDQIRLRRGPKLTPIAPLHLIYRARADLYRKRTLEEREALEARHRGHYLEANDFARFQARELGLSEGETQALALGLGGEKSLSDLYRESPLSYADTHAMIFALLDLGAIVFRETMPLKVRARQMKERIAQKHRRVSHQSALVVLEMAVPFTREQLRQTYRQLYRQYDCTELERILPREVVTMSRDILRHLDDAFEQALALAAKAPRAVA